MTLKGETHTHEKIKYEKEVYQKSNLESDLRDVTI